MDRAAGELSRLKFSIHSIYAVVERYWQAIREERRSKELRAALYALSDRDLKDFGISHGMIEHIGCNATVDPRYTGLGDR